MQIFNRSSKSRENPKKRKHAQEIVDLINALHQRRKRGYALLLKDYKEEFMSWAKGKFPKVTQELIEDAYHEALVIFIEKYIYTNKIRVEHGEVIGLTAKLSTFIFQIAKFKLIKMVKERSTQANIQAMNEAYPEDEPIDTEKIRKAFSMLDEKCQKLIREVVLNGASYEELVELLEGKNEQVLRVQKYRCIKKLRTIYNNLNR